MELAVACLGMSATTYNTPRVIIANTRLEHGIYNATEMNAEVFTAHEHYSCKVNSKSDRARPYA